MTDEEKAEESFKNHIEKDNCYFSKAEINVYKDGYLDGLKDGRKELEKENEKQNNVNNDLITMLKAQIEKMKCCENCIFKSNGMDYELGEPCYRCEGFSNWELEK